MIIKKHGKSLIHGAATLGMALGGASLQAQNVNPDDLVQRCAYNDCAIFHECTDHHDRVNLAEVNASGIVTSAVLTPIDIPCHAYTCFAPERQEQVAEEKCERSKELAELVLAIRELRFQR